MRRIIAASAALGVLSFHPSAHASPVTRTYDIVASGFESIFGPTTTAPVDPVIGSFTVTLDPTLGFHPPSTAGLTINALNIAYVTPVEVAYSVLGNNIVVATDLIVATPPYLAFGTRYNTNDFGFSIDTPFTAPSLSDFVYSIASDSSVFEATALSLTVVPAPEPSSFALVAAALVSLAFIARFGGRPV